ncbi:MAG: ATP-binding cassette domain-containing protein [Clostridiales bacterium]|nr:ATP-binding cassette domain-containing protein [Clostridiales bacterium]
MQKSGFAPKKYLKAVDRISLSVGKAETLGIVGESGCGKSTLGRAILQIHKPTAGKVFFHGIELTGLSEKQMAPFRRRMQMIFQDPYASLNPRYTVGDIIEEPMVIHKLYPPAERRRRVQELLLLVGLKPDHIRRYPHEFSGGQRQRIGIARTLATEPDFIVCDEPISALDVSIQAQIINLLEKIQRESGVSYLFIAHDLSMVRHISHRIGVMYLGSMVEYGPVELVYGAPLHPYTRLLLSSEPIADPKRARATHVHIPEGELPSPIDAPPGCPFCSRCAYILPECTASRPPDYRQPDGRTVRCYQYSQRRRQQRRAFGVADITATQ